LALPLPAVNGRAAALDEQHEQVEVARDERDLGARDRSKSA
jgi:hypothetical protein